MKSTFVFLELHQMTVVPRVEQSWQLEVSEKSDIVHSFLVLSYGRHGMKSTFGYLVLELRPMTVPRVEQSWQLEVS